MSNLAYVANSLAWGVGGAVAGFFLGRLTVDVHAVRETIVESEEEKTVDDLPKRFRWFHRLLSSRSVGVILILLALGTIGQGVYYSHTTNHITKCQASYNKEFTQQLIARARIQGQDRQDLIRLMSDFAVAKTPEDGEAALQRFLSAEAKADKDRAAHPIPDPPSDAKCRG